MVKHHPLYIINHIDMSMFSMEGEFDWFFSPKQADAAMTGISWDFSYFKHLKWLAWSLFWWWMEGLSPMFVGIIYWSEHMRSTIFMLTHSVYIYIILYNQIINLSILEWDQLEALWRSSMLMVWLSWGI